MEGEGEVLLVSPREIRLNDRLTGCAQLQTFHSFHIRLPGTVQSMQVGHLRRCVENRFWFRDLVPIEDLKIPLEEVDHLARLDGLPCDLFRLQVVRGEALGNKLAQMFCKPEEVGYYFGFWYLSNESLSTLGPSPLWCP